ncbi:Zinc finger MYM-type protein 1 [Merluccius polli]|uniref:Zinc finger MYM-type protein 1 n=1 Tax=Merluccius polli TaxID=89951 RepID=A0AA47N7U2_MERPO|nr:Zinc finger MYM-type protein 1 [Merluccius polli]
MRFGTESFSRSFKSAWFEKWKWLHYVKDINKALCYTCCSVVERKLIQEEKMRADAVFIRGGFSNWRKATEKFRDHEKSSFHLEAVNKIAALKNTPISALLSDVVAREQNTARVVLQEASKSVRYLARQGLPLRGHDHRDGHFWRMMIDRTESLPEARQWMLRRDNWLSDNIQNELIEQLAHAVQRKLVNGAMVSHYFGLTADGTTDISSSEQFSCHVHYVDSDLCHQSVFLGFYNAPDSKADTLFRCITDMFLRLHLPIEKLQGYCFDGASNMSGRFTGVRARLAEICPGSLFVHCCNHSLDLALQEVARDVTLIADIFNFVQSASNLIRESAKRKSLYQSLFPDGEAVSNIAALCPTRWCVRTRAISRLLQGYVPLLETLRVLQNDKSVRGETRQKISGLLKQAMKGRTVFGLLCCEAMFGPCEAVARSLQGADANVSGAIECILALKERIGALRGERVVETYDESKSVCISSQPEVARRFQGQQNTISFSGNHCVGGFSRQWRIKVET